MATTERPYLTYAPRTFSYCPVVSKDSFESGFASCERLTSSTNYGGENASDVFALQSLAWNFTQRLALRDTESTKCGPALANGPYSPTAAPQGLSCVQQIRLAPFTAPGGNDDSFFTCARETARREYWPGTDYWGEPIIVAIMVAIFFLIPVLSVVWLRVLSYRSSKKLASTADEPPKTFRERLAWGNDVRDSSRESMREEASGRESTRRDAAKGGEAGRVYLSFENVYYSVTLNASAQKAALEKAKEEQGGKKSIKPSEMPPFWDTKVIIKGVSGAFAPGSLSAIMGPSGCGKSTLLNVLADRMRVGNTSGDVLLNGHPRGMCFKRACGYVMQSDALFANLTVREMLSFTAELRVSGSDVREKGERVNRVLRELDLVRVADSRIGGGNIRGISGGQARRCTVGVELVTQPSVLFLDEPTTGLDAYSSLLLVRSLRKLSDSGRTVLCTIHQPRPDIFKLFDTLLLMSAGEVAYFGECQQIGPYLGDVGITIPDDHNPADFVVDLTYARDDENVVEKLVNSWRTSERGAKMAKLVRSLGSKTFQGAGTEYCRVEDVYEKSATAKSDGSKATAAGTPQSSAFARPLLWQIYSLMRRSFTNTARAPDVIRRIMGFPLLNYLFFGLLYVGTRMEWDRAPAEGFTADDAELERFTNLISQKRSFYFQVMATAILTESSVMGEAFDEQRAFRREHASGAYSILAYHLQWALRLNFRAIYKSVVFSAVVYFFPAHAPNTYNDGHFQSFLFFLAVMCVCSTVGSALALLFISLIPDAEGAAGAHNAVAAVLLQYSGFYLLPCLMPPLVNTAYFISFGKYALEAMLRNEFATVPSGTQYYLYHSVQHSLDPSLSRWANVAVLMVYPFAFHLLALLSSLLQTRPKSFWAPLEDWRHKKMPARFPARDVLARGGAAPPVQVTLEPAVDVSSAKAAEEAV